MIGLLRLDRVLAIERDGAQRGDVDAVEAADIDGNHLAAIRFLAARKGSDPAFPAEQVMDPFLAELIVDEVLVAGAKSEVLGRNERP